MILITNVEIKNISKDFVELIKQKPYLFGDDYWDSTQESISITRELVIGRRYRNSRGINIVIGMDKETQELLGIPFKDFDRMSNIIEEITTENDKLRKELREIKELKFLGKLKFLFTGR